MKRFSIGIILVFATLGAWSAGKMVKRYFFPPSTYQIWEGPEEPVAAWEPLLRQSVRHRYAVVPGGVPDLDTFNRAKIDPLVHKHYENFYPHYRTYLTHDYNLFVSYKKDGRIWWTRGRKRFVKGTEVLVSTTGDMIRAGCGNRLSDKPQEPVEVGRKEDPELEVNLAANPMNNFGYGPGRFSEDAGSSTAVEKGEIGEKVGLGASGSTIGTSTTKCPTCPPPDPSHPGYYPLITGPLLLFPYPTVIPSGSPALPNNNPDVPSPSDGPPNGGDTDTPITPTRPHIDLPSGNPCVTGRYVRPGQPVLPRDRCQDVPAIPVAPIVVPPFNPEVPVPAENVPEPQFFVCILFVLLVMFLLKRS